MRAFHVVLAILVSWCFTSCSTDNGNSADADDPASDIADSGDDRNNGDDVDSRYPDDPPVPVGDDDEPLTQVDAPEDSCESLEETACNNSEFCERRCTSDSDDSANCIPNCVVKPCTSFPSHACPAVICELQQKCDGAVCAPLVSTSSFDGECGPHGYGGADLKCCSGLERRCGVLLGSGECSGGGFPTCVACGDGECTPPEDRCNCAEDCAN